MPGDAASAIHALFTATTLGIELDEGLTVRAVRGGSERKITSVEISSRTETVSFSLGVADDLIAVLQAAKMER